MNVNRRSTRAPGRSPRESGYVLVMMALLMFPLLAVAGFATDVGSWYVQGSKLQRAADAAALAGVVWMPDLDAAEAAAAAAMAKNGFDPTSGRYEVSVYPVGPSRLRVVVLDTDADMFFSKLVLDEMQIQRGATAEYLRPLPLGSPLNSFGQDPSCATSSCRPNFWAAIQGPFTRKDHGDPYATSCIGVGTPAGTACSTPNPEYRPEGYWYQVEVPQSLIDFFGGAVPVNIEVYDAGFYNRADPFTETGDFMVDGSTTQPGFQVEVFRNDSTPLDHTDNPSWPGGACRRTIDGGASAATYQNVWHRVCRVVVTEPVSLPVNVRTSDLASGATTGSATSNYSLRVRAECGAALCPAARQPRLYGVGDFSIFLNPGGGSTSEFFVAEVNEQSRGKELSIELFDPGDGSSGNYYMSVIDPRTDAPFSSCAWSASDGRSGTVTPCRIQTSANGTSQFNGVWLRFQVPIAATYACTPPDGTGCWWKVRYEFPGASRPSDRITARVSVRGDPIRLVR